MQLRCQGRWFNLNQLFNPHGQGFDSMQRIAENSRQTLDQMSVADSARRRCAIHHYLYIVLIGPVRIHRG